MAKHINRAKIAAVALAVATIMGVRMFVAVTRSSSASPSATTDHHYDPPATIPFAASDKSAQETIPANITIKDAEQIFRMESPSRPVESHEPPQADQTPQPPPDLLSTDYNPLQSRSNRWSDSLEVSPPREVTHTKWQQQTPDQQNN